MTNDIFAENAWYFRNSQVRANYNDLKNGIHETTEYLEVFLRNLLLNENHPLHNRTLHITGTFMETKKPDIDNLKPDIDDLKPDIEVVFQPKTVSHILKLREAFPGQTIFGRSDVMKVIERSVQVAFNYKGLPNSSEALCQLMIGYIFYNLPE